MRTVRATRYLMPLREGGSLPAVVAGDDDGLYVLKFRGAGQGARALVAELLAGELARAAGLPVPELVLMELDPALGRNEPDPEIRELIKASPGLNVALDYLPGSLMFDPIASDPIDARTASAIVWFDAFVMNVDRTAKNPNLLVWHGKVWLIDHGASLYFQHDWSTAEARMNDPFPAIKHHVLLPIASELERVAREQVQRLEDAQIERAVESLPDSWLLPEPNLASPAAVRQAYRRWLIGRRNAAPHFLAEAQRARQQLI